MNRYPLNQSYGYFPSRLRCLEKKETRKKKERAVRKKKKYSFCVSSQGSMASNPTAGSKSASNNNGDIVPNLPQGPRHSVPPYSFAQRQFFPPPMMWPPPFYRPRTPSQAVYPGPSFSPLIPLQTEEGTFDPTAINSDWSQEWFNYYGNGPEQGKNPFNGMCTFYHTNSPTTGCRFS